MKHLLVIASLLLVATALTSTVSEARSEREWQRRYCEGMEIDVHLSSGGEVDCLSADYAIEVDCAKDWHQSVC